MLNPISPADLPALRKLDAERTLGEWEYGVSDRNGFRLVAMDDRVLGGFPRRIAYNTSNTNSGAFERHKANFAFIAATSTEFRRLLDTVEALYARVLELEGHEPERLRKAVGEVNR